jgi:hypothetical protein
MTIFNPSVLKKIAIAPYLNQLFYDQSASLLPFLNATVDHFYAKTPAPFVDCINGQQIADFQIHASNQDNYIFGVCENFSINSIPYYKSIKTFTYSDFFAQPQNNVLITEGNIKIPMVFPYTTESVFAKFLESIWRIAIYPFVPFTLYTDMSPVNLGGPLFSKKFLITVDESSPVSMGLDFIGGTAILPPSPGSIDANNFPFTDNYVAGISTDGITYNATFSYRTAKAYDCLFGIPVPIDIDSIVGIYSGYNASSGWYSNQTDTNIISMSLSIDQEIVLVFTGNDGVFKNIADSVKYISMKHRTVSGNIKFISSINLEHIYKNPKDKIQELILYFGGPFYFPMKNVTIDFFSSELQPQNGSFLHDIKFIARLQAPTIEDDVDINLNPTPWYQLNEFDISYLGLYEPITGAIYVDQQ